MTEVLPLGGEGPCLAVKGRMWALSGRNSRLREPPPSARQKKVEGTNILLCRQGPAFLGLNSQLNSLGSFEIGVLFPRLPRETLLGSRYSLYIYLFHKS